MFERFTETSRLVVVRAQEEARQLGHNYIGTEHILLGILAEQDRLAARLLASLDVTPGRVGAELARRVAPSDDAPPGQVPFTPRAKRVLELSLREALSLGHSSIETEHLLLGLLRETEGMAAQILNELGTDPKRLRVTLIEAMPGPDPSPLVTAAPPGPPPAPATAWAVTATPEPSARRVLMRAAARALEQGRSEFTVEDLLAALPPDVAPPGGTEPA